MTVVTAQMGLTARDNLTWIADQWPRLRAALDAIHDARTTGGQQGTTYALTAIAHAILARTENP